eukprot:11085652-Alexandrium_andersonii.AAC.1
MNACVAAFVPRIPPEMPTALMVGAMAVATSVLVSALQKLARLLQGVGRTKRTLRGGPSKMGCGHPCPKPNG